MDWAKRACHRGQRAEPPRRWSNDPPHVSADHDEYRRIYSALGVVLFAHPAAPGDGGGGESFPSRRRRSFFAAHPGAQTVAERIRCGPGGGVVSRLFIRPFRISATI